MARLKETILSQLALNTLFTVCADYLEREMEEMDQREKIKSVRRLCFLATAVARNVFFLFVNMNGRIEPLY